MTKNKKRKTILRTIAENEGVGIARAGMLHDRERLGKNLDPGTKFALNREWSTGWSLCTVGRGPVKVHFASDSPYSLINDPDKVGATQGIPHYVITKGTHAQRFRFLDGIRRQISENVSSNEVVLRETRLEDDLSSLIAMHGSRRNAMAEVGAENFVDLRIDAIRKNGTFDDDTSYIYVFIYDWHELMANASDVFKNQVDWLLGYGKETGIHFIISAGLEDEHVKMWDEQSMVRFITIRNTDAGQLESAVTKIGGLWWDVEIPTWGKGVL